MRLGYAQVEKNGQIVSSASAISINDTISMHLADGKIDCVVTNKQEK